MTQHDENDTTQQNIDARHRCTDSTDRMFKTRRRDIATQIATETNIDTARCAACQDLRDGLLILLGFAAHSLVWRPQVCYRDGWQRKRSAAFLFCYTFFFCYTPTRLVYVVLTLFLLSFSGVHPGSARRPPPSLQPKVFGSRRG